MSKKPSIPIPPNHEWPKDEIERLANSTGRPLEIRCAAAFWRTGWKAKIGSYFTDGTVARELDVLCEKRISFTTKDPHQREFVVDVLVRVLCSCKGFPPELSPVMYTIESRNDVLYKPMLISALRSRAAEAISERSSERVANTLVDCAKLSDEPQIVAFDIFKCEEVGHPPALRYDNTKSDGLLYSGLDSAIKAAAYWRQIDHTLFRGYFLSVNIPLLVTSLPWWSASIDEGKVQGAVVKGLGKTVSLYPLPLDPYKPTPIMTLICAEDQLGKMVSAIDKFWETLNTHISLRRPFDYDAWPDDF